MFSLNMVDFLMSFFDGQVGVMTKFFLLFEFFLWDPSFMLKIYRWVAPMILVSAPVPFGLILVLNWLGVGP